MDRESAKPFIAVTSEVLESLEKILQSGRRGVHLLFSNSVIREAFEREIEIDLLSDEDLAAELQTALTDLVSLEDLEERQDFIESLESRVRDVLVHLYFGFLDKFVDDDEFPEVLH